jgi:predicted HicB family RNase H-like nuclease
MPKRKDTVRITAVFTNDVAEKLNIVAEKQGRSLSSLVSQLVKEGLERMDCAT